MAGPLWEFQCIIKLMLPVLLTVGPVRIYAYGLFLFLGLFLGLFEWWRLGKDENLDEVKLFDAFFLGLIWFLIGARLANWWWGGGQSWNWWQALAILSYPGLVDWVGIGVALLSLVAFSRKQDWSVMKILDMAAVVLSLILVIANLGGFLDGANPGKSFGVFGVKYPGFDRPVFPVDLWGVGWFGLSWWLTDKVRREFRFYEWYKGKRGTAKDGLSFLVFGIMVGGYYLGDYFLGGHGYWWTSLGLVVVCLGGVYYLAGKKIELKIELKDKPTVWKKKLKKIIKKLRK